MIVEGGIVIPLPRGQRAFLYGWNYLGLKASHYNLRIVMLGLKTLFDGSEGRGEHVFIGYMCSMVVFTKIIFF